VAMGLVVHCMGYGMVQFE